MEQNLFNLQTSLEKDWLIIFLSRNPGVLTFNFMQVHAKFQLENKKDWEDGEGRVLPGTGGQVVIRYLSQKIFKGSPPSNLII